MTKPPAIDLEHLARYSGGDAALEEEVFSLFRQQVELWVRLLEPNTDMESWAAAAHSLKGSARSIGAHQLASACETAETVSAAGPIQRSVAAQDVRQRADAALQFIDEHLYRLKIQALRKSSKRENS